MHTAPISSYPIQCGDTRLSAENKIKELGLDLSQPAAPIANYVSAVSTGRLVFLSGKGPNQDDGTMIRGKVGRDLDVDETSGAVEPHVSHPEEAARERERVRIPYQGDRNVVA